MAGKQNEFAVLPAAARLPWAPRGFLKPRKLKLSHLAFDQIPVSLAIDFFIVQKDAVLGSGAHEVVVAGAGGEAATHRGPRLLAELTPLTIQKQRSPSQTSSGF